jgi:hypothetical protein
VVLHVSDRMPASSQTSRARHASGFPYYESLTGGPRLAFERLRELEAVSGRTVPGPGPLNLISYFFQNKQNLKIVKTTLLYSKIYQTLQSDRINDKEQLSFWKQVQIPNMTGIKIPVSKLLLNLN